MWNYRARKGPAKVLIHMAPYAPRFPRIPANFPAVERETGPIRPMEIGKYFGQVVEFTGIAGASKLKL